MSEAIDFIQYRLAHVSYRRERWLAERIGRINVLHNRRIRFDERVKDRERGQTKRTYYKKIIPNSYFSKFCVQMNAMVDQLREKGQAAVVLDFTHYKKTQEQRESPSTKQSIISREVN